MTCPHCVPGTELFGLCHNVDLDAVVQGFPTFRNIPFTHEFKQLGIVVFDQPTRGTSMLIKVKPPYVHFPSDLIILHILVIIECYFSLLISSWFLTIPLL
jgi:hypothetical protein